MGKKIMIVDDDAGFLHLTEKLLNSHGYSTVCLEHPKKFLKILKKEQPDLVMLDILLPEVDGYKLCEEVKNLYGDKFPIILCTAKDYEKDFIEEAYKDFSADNFIIKPFDSDEFLNKVKELIC